MSLSATFKIYAPSVVTQRTFPSLVHSKPTLHSLRSHASGSEVTGTALLSCSRLATKLVGDNRNCPRFRRVRQVDRSTLPRKAPPETGLSQTIMVYFDNTKSVSNRVREIVVLVYRIGIVVRLVLFVSGRGSFERKRAPAQGRQKTMCLPHTHSFLP